MKLFLILSVILSSSAHAGYFHAFCKNSAGEHVDLFLYDGGRAYLSWPSTIDVGQYESRNGSFKIARHKVKAQFHDRSFEISAALYFSNSSSPEEMRRSDGVLSYADNTNTFECVKN